MNQAEHYDIVIHDCFSGGGVPQQLYTKEFFEELGTLLTRQGVLVVVRQILFFQTKL